MIYKLNVNIFTNEFSPSRLCFSLFGIGKKVPIYNINFSNLNKLNMLNIHFRSFVVFHKKKLIQNFK